MDNIEDEFDLEAPFSEFHSRESRKRLTYSRPDHQGVVECHRCRKRFPDLVHFYAHASSKLTVDINSIHPPYPGMFGRWVKRNQFEGENSFGFYQCCNCTRIRGETEVWISAYAYVSYGQGCKRCNDKQWMNAVFMWQNLAPPVNSRGRSKKNYEGHQKDLCEACELGRCRYRMRGVE